MKYLLLSDIHADFNFNLYNKKHQNDWSDEQANDTFTKWWNMKQLPQTEGIVIAGDISNDARSWKQFVNFIKDKYKEVIITLGNHDLVVKGATCSESNRAFVNSEMKIKHLIDFCNKIPNVHLLEGDTYGSFAGCMGMSDFKAEVMPAFAGTMPLIWRRQWFDGCHWKYFNQIPLDIWDHYEKLMMELVKKQPKVMVTHFCPVELGVGWEYRNNYLNPMFYFTGKKFLDEMADGSIWICGHIHQFATAEYINDKGNKITIMARPHGYPGENSLQGFEWNYDDTKGRLGYNGKIYTIEDAIIDV